MTPMEKYYQTLEFRMFLAAKRAWELHKGRYAATATWRAQEKMLWQSMQTQLEECRSTRAHLDAFGWMNTRRVNGRPVHVYGRCACGAPTVDGECAVVACAQQPQEREDLTAHLFAEVR